MEFKDPKQAIENTRKNQRIDRNILSNKLKQWKNRKYEVIISDNTKFLTKFPPFSQEIPFVTITETYII